MKKVLSITLMAALSVMLAYGVTLAAGEDQAYGQGTVTVSNLETVGPANDVWMVLRSGDTQIGDWSKTNTILGDPTLIPDVPTVSHVLMLKNKKTVDCSGPEGCPTITDSLPEYKLMIDSYDVQNFEAEPIQEIDPVEVKIVDLATGAVIYAGDLSALESQPFKVGYTYVDIMNNNSLIREDISELEFTFYYPETAVDAYIEYGIRAQELPQ